MALGNAVVPACAEIVGWVIRELIEIDMAPQEIDMRGLDISLRCDIHRT
jgi:hypothetical protein